VLFINEKGDLDFEGSCRADIGFSVKCFKNDYSLGYKYFELNNTFWSANHLNVTNFRNGDTILEANSDEAWENAGG